MNQVDNTGMSITYVITRSRYSMVIGINFLATSVLWLLLWLFLPWYHCNASFLSSQWLWLCLMTMSRTSLHLLGTRFFEQILLTSACNINVPSHPLIL